MHAFHVAFWVAFLTVWFGHFGVRNCCKVARTKYEDNHTRWELYFATRVSFLLGPIGTIFLWLWDRSPIPSQNA